MTNLESILQSRDITLPTKVHLAKAMIFPVVTYGCEDWTIKKAECWRIDASELWCWRRLLRVPWTATRSNQSIPKEISPEYSLEGLMLKLKLQYFGHLMRIIFHWKRPWCSERLTAGGEGDDRGWDGWMASLTRRPWVWASSGSWWWTGRPGVLRFTGLQRVRHDWATELNWTDSDCITLKFQVNNFLLSSLDCKILGEKNWLTQHEEVIKQGDGAFRIFYLCPFETAHIRDHTSNQIAKHWFSTLAVQPLSNEVRS